jgi:hypothetical protein
MSRESIKIELLINLPENLNDMDRHQYIKGEIQTLNFILETTEVNGRPIKSEPKLKWGIIE